MKLNNYLKIPDQIKRTAVIGGTIMGAIIAFFIFTFFTPNYYERSAPVEFIIKKGESLNEILDDLEKKKIIDDKDKLYFAAKIWNAERYVKAGRYEIPNGLSYYELMRFLLKGQPEPSTLITIPEGIWQHNLASIFSRELGLDSNKFLKLSKDREFIKSLNLSVNNLEGYLLPDTYYFTNSSNEKEVIEKLINQTRDLILNNHKDQLKKLGMSLHEVLTMASIIDGETNIPSEFKTISGVYHNRLKKGMRLQADPTVQYLIRHKKRHNKIYYKDLEIDSRYNTYKYGGLPPGPINNPGKEAILAALYPEKHDYYYFVADGKGGHKFARTYSEQQKNVIEYRRFRRLNQ